MSFLCLKEFGEYVFAVFNEFYFVAQDLLDHSWTGSDRRTAFAIRASHGIVMRCNRVQFFISV